MFFQARGTFTPGVVGPDPIMNPGDVPENMLLRLPTNPPASDFGLSVNIVVLDAPVAETLTVDVYVADDAILARIAAAPDPFLPALLATRKFYLLQSALVMVGGAVNIIGSAVFQSGTLYLRPTADLLTTARDVLGSAV